MKPNTSAILAALGLGLVSSASAAVNLLTDSFNTVTTFTASPNADQTGELGPASYTLSSYNGAVSAIRGTNGYLELAGTGTRVFTDADYVSYANLYNTAIQFSFTYNAANADWMGFSVGNGSAWVNEVGNTEFGALFTNAGASQVWDNGVAQTNPAGFTYPSTITLELRGGDGGSAFDGAGSVAQIWAGSTSLGTYTLDQLNATNGKFAFNSWNGNGGAGASVDNFSITATVPEPSAALLGGLGLLALLRRRR